MIGMICGVPMDRHEIIHSIFFGLNPSFWTRYPQTQFLYFAQTNVAWCLHYQTWPKPLFHRHKWCFPSTFHWVLKSGSGIPGFSGKTFWNGGALHFWSSKPIHSQVPASTIDPIVKRSDEATEQENRKGLAPWNGGLSFTVTWQWIKTIVQCRGMNIHKSGSDSPGDVFWYSPLWIWENHLGECPIFIPIPMMYFGIHHSFPGVPGAWIDPWPTSDRYGGLDKPPINQIV